MSTGLNLIQSYNTDGEDDENELSSESCPSESKSIETAAPINPELSIVSKISVNSAPVVFYSVITH